MAMKEDDENIQSFVLAKKDEPFPTQSEFENNALSAKPLILYKQIFSLSEMVKDLQQKMNPLIQENETLKKEIYELKEKFNYSKILKGSFYNKESKWFPYCDSLWKLFSFDSMEGNIEQASSSAFIIPEDGVYSLRVHYCWRSAKGYAGACTGISINNDQNVKSHAHHHMAKEGDQTEDELHFTTHLKKGEKVMTSILGHQNVEYFSGEFKFYIEKIN